jgi:hypothetical protein
LSKPLGEIIAKERGAKEILQKPVLGQRPVSGQRPVLEQKSALSPKPMLGIVSKHEDTVRSAQPQARMPGEKSKAVVARKVITSESEANVQLDFLRALIKEKQGKYDLAYRGKYVISAVKSISAKTFPMIYLTAFILNNGNKRKISFAKESHKALIFDNYKMAASVCRYMQEALPEKYRVKYEFEVRQIRRVRVLMQKGTGFYPGFDMSHPVLREQNAVRKSTNIEELLAPMAEIGA